MTLGCRTAPWPPFGVHSMSDLGWRWGSLMVSPPPHLLWGEEAVSSPPNLTPFQRGGLSRTDLNSALLGLVQPLPTAASLSLGFSLLFQKGRRLLDDW